MQRERDTQVSNSYEDSPRRIQIIQMAVGLKRTKRDFRDTEGWIWDLDQQYIKIFQKSPQNKTTKTPFSCQEETLEFSTNISVFLDIVGIYLFFI